MYIRVCESSRNRFDGLTPHLPPSCRCQRERDRQSDRDRDWEKRIGWVSKEATILLRQHPSVQPSYYYFSKRQKFDQHAEIRTWTERHRRPTSLTSHCTSGCTFVSVVKSRVVSGEVGLLAGTAIPEMGGGEEELSLTQYCHHQNDPSIQMGSGVSH